MVIGGYSINGCLLMVVILVAIGGYSINGYLLMVVILMAIGGYSINGCYINGYWWLFY